MYPSTPNTPQPVDRSQWPDAAIAAEASALAMQEGRYQLGLSFARIAMEAHRAHQRQIGQAPPPPGALPDPSLFQLAEQAQTDMFGNGEDARPLEVPVSARCVAQMQIDGINDECHGVIARDITGRWYHVHPADHEPVLPVDQG